MVYSPLSIQVVLWLLTAGSKSTDQLNSLASHLVPLIFTDGSTEGGPCLSFANGLWVKDTIPIKPSFKEVVDTAYKALSPGLIDHTTTLIFSNALYFKGLWSRKFDASITITDNFHLLNGTSVKAPFMRSSGEHFVRAFDGFKVLKLPYSQGEDKERQFSMHLFPPDETYGLPALGEDKERQFSMYLLLPDEKYGLPALVERVCSEPGFLDRHQPGRRVPVGDFKIPRFKITSGFTASEILMDLGLVLPFNGDGDLTEMLESGIGEAKMIHKSFIEVDEEGTKAAAASVYYTLMCSAGPVERIEDIDFVADHPFLLLIREETTGTVMFIGHVLNPLKE
ncbi:serpin-ZX-like [Pyrus ussuriensis x Pyrus communis]|uniref:Serpin-ZX-like n=1 Tax=Pyrus ussuriensis x Pyrus communis TaxID=2448454 RepID=A0A5N5GQI4_9ROSA|nr:serpin-ZX-like [Pyrus ussuriensis x Pyrus communis]